MHLQTPLVHSTPLSRHCGQPVWLKLESAQPTGSFKLRGATNKLLSLGEAERARGVVAASTGNHGLAVSQAAAWNGSFSLRSFPLGSFGSSSFHLTYPLNPFPWMR